MPPVMWVMTALVVALAVGGMLLMWLDK